MVSVPNLSQYEQKPGIPRNCSVNFGQYMGTVSSQTWQPSYYLQSEQEKHYYLQSEQEKLFNANNEDTRKTPMTSF